VIVRLDRVATAPTSESETLGHAGEPRSALATAAFAVFLLFVAALPWSIAAMSIGLAMAAVATVVVWLARPTRWRWPRPLLLPAIAWIAALVIAALFAEDRGASLPRITKGALPAIAWITSYHARRRRDGERALTVLLVSAGVVALLGIGVWVAQGAAFPARARGAVGHYMTFAGQLLLWMSVASGIFLRAARRWRIGAALALTVGGVALAATFTRSAWIGMFVSWATMLALTRPRALVGLALAAALLVAIAPRAYRDRMLSSFDPGHATNVERTHMWQAGLEMFRDHPLTGVGLEDLHPIYERYKPPTAREPAGHLHSVFIQIAATMGVIGLAAFAWLYPALFRTATGGASLGEAGLGPGVRLGVVGALAGFLAAGLFEWNFGDEELLDLLYALVGIAWAAGGWSSRDGEPASRS
jgi:O-antigen ligase